MNQKLISDKSEKNHTYHTYLKDYGNYPKPIGSILGLPGTPHVLFYLPVW
jgi:hypothetical protein